MVAQPIIGGSPATSCQWPTAVGAVNCTSTLVHPRIITTADHCVADGGPTHITFGERWSGAGVVRTVPVDRMFRGGRGRPGGRLRVLHPGRAGRHGDHAGPVRVRDRDPDRRAARHAGGVRPAGLVGRPGRHQIQGRRSGRGARTGSTSTWATAAAAPATATRAGPPTSQLADGSWRVFGATSRGALFCNGESIYTLIHPFVPWLEQTSGIDITPCHDSDGTWNPTAACTGFPTNPEAGAGTWDDMCAAINPAAPLHLRAGGFPGTLMG